MSPKTQSTNSNQRIPDPPASWQRSQWKLALIVAYWCFCLFLIMRSVMHEKSSGATHLLPLWMRILFGFVCGHMACDLASVFTHWILDNYFDEETPLIGPTIVKYFREHHYMVYDMFSRNYAEGNFENAMLSAAVVGVGCFMWYNTCLLHSVFWAVSLGYMGFAGTLVTQAHKWSHQFPNSPYSHVWYRSLFTQFLHHPKYHLLVNYQQHHAHHTDSSHYYSLYAGWMDAPLDAILLLEALEVIIYLLTGRIAVESRLFPKEEAKEMRWKTENTNFNQRFMRMKWRVWYAFFAASTRMMGVPRFHCMNWGYVPLNKQEEQRIQVTPDFDYSTTGLNPSAINTLKEMRKHEKFNLQMYALCVDTVPSIATNPSDLTILDVSCGRGGGLSFLHSKIKPKKSIGVDFTSANIEECNKIWNTDASSGQLDADSNIQFRQGNAEHLPWLAESSADILMSVEASHCYPTLRNFLVEAHRVLKNGGYLTWVDFASPKEYEQYQKWLEELGFKIRESRSISDNVLRAMEQDSGRKKQLIEKYTPKILQRLFLRFAAADERSETVKMFRDKSQLYFLIRAEK